jgi:hypothetical protein
MSAKEIILCWLETSLARNDGAILLRTSHLHEQVKSWGKKHFDKPYSATNYERRWRELRGTDKAMLTTRGITEAKIDESPEATWIVSSLPGHTMTDYEMTDHEQAAASASGA